MHWHKRLIFVMERVTMTILLSTFCYVRYQPRMAVAFSVQRSFSKITTPTTIPTGKAVSSNQESKGLRRAKTELNPWKTMAYITKMKREHGMYQDYEYGAFLTPTKFPERPSDSEYPIGQLPEMFPLEGKDPANIPARMRFAPSPTGSLHVGGARTALYNYLVAKKAQSRKLYDNEGPGGAFVLRIEDTDVARSTKESERSVLSDLRWLGLDWDEGPDMSLSVARYGPYRQSERSNIYIEAAVRLMQLGKAYRCFCTPEELEEMKQQQEAAGEVVRYDGRWRDADPALVDKLLSENRPFTVRFKVTPGSRVVIDDIVRGTVAWDAEATVGDFILLRSSKIPVYNFCVAVDDASMAISTVVRAEEHLTNTLRQALILDALGAPRPRYAHCSLILGEDKQKLSKRHGATSCDQYRIDGFLPDAMINYLALLGWNDGTENEIFTRDELIEAFDLNRVVKSPSVFDIEKLKWVNGQHLKMMSIDSVVPFVKDQLLWQNMLKDDVETIDYTNPDLHKFALAATSLAKQMMLTTKDAVMNAKTVLEYNLPQSFHDVTDKEMKEMIEMGSFYPLAIKILEQYDTGVLPLPSMDNPLEAFEDSFGQDIEADDAKGEASTFAHNYMAHMKALAKDMKLRGKVFFHPLRLMLTGEMSGQDVTKQLSLVVLTTSLTSSSSSMSGIDENKMGLVTIPTRMERLRLFCDTIPTEFRQPSLPQTDSTSHSILANEVINGVKPSMSNTGTMSAVNIEAVPIDPKDTYSGPPITALDIRVGRIVNVWEHEEADKLYCEEIDVGEGQPRRIASGLRPYLSKHELENRLCLVLCNLKERKLVGFPSHGMVLCASNKDKTVVKLVNPPVDAKVGERITFADLQSENNSDNEPYAENKIAKKKVFEEIGPYLQTNKYGIPVFLDRPFMTSAGACTSPIQNGSVS